MNDAFLQPKDGLLPKHIPEDEILTMEDVHRGPFGIWLGMQGTAFIDIDGTVADLTHRRGYLTPDPMTGKKNYPAFERTMMEDTPIEPVINAVRLLFDEGWTIVMCSGRAEKNRRVTMGWLNTYSVPFNALYMRRDFLLNPDGSRMKTKKGDKFKPDYRPDYIVKKELLDWARLDGYDPDVVFDDRNQVVDMWRENGIPCVQVAEGDF